MYQDLGLRIVILGASQARRDIGMVRGDINALEATIRKVSGSTATFGQNLTRMGAALSSIGRTMTVSVTTPLLALGGALVGTGIGFEDAFAGVGKTVDGVSVGFKEIVQMTPTLSNQVQAFANQMNALGGPGQQMTWDEAFNALLLTMPDVTKNIILADERFGQLTYTGQRLKNEFIDLSMQIPFSASALAEIGRVAGQMGVPENQLIDFTKVVAELGVATNISGQDAAFAIARTANIFGVSGDQMGKFALQFGSAIVDLGNSTAATESEILNISTRMSAVGRMAGMSVPDILGWGASMAEMGVRSELGGTAFSRVIYEMLDAVNAGGDGLKQYADIAGMSADQFAATFRANPTRALGEFLSKLTELEKEGKISQDTLTAMGFEGIRVKQVMDLLGPNMQLVTDNVDRANVAWQQQIALQQEAQKKFATTKAKIQLVKNAFVSMGISIFDLYKNKIDKFLERLQNLFVAFKKLPAPTQKWIVTLGLLAAAAGPVLVILGTILQSAGTVITAFSAIPSVISGVFTSFVGLLPILLPIAAVAGIIYYAWSKNFAGLREVVNKFADTLKWFKALWIDNIIYDLKHGDFSGAFQGLQDAFSVAVDWLKTTGLSLLTGWAGTAKDEILGKLDDISSTVQSKLGDVGTFLSGSIPTLFKGITDTASGFKDFFGAFEGTKTAGFNEVWKTLLVFLGLLATLVGAGLSALAPLLKPLGEGLSNIITATSNWLQAVKPSEKLIEFLNNLNIILKTLPKDVLSGLGKELSTLDPMSITFLAVSLGALALVLGFLSLKLAVLNIVIPTLTTVLGSLGTVLGTLSGLFFPVIVPLLLLVSLFLALKDNTYGISDNIREVGKHFQEIRDAIGKGDWIDAVKNLGGALWDIAVAVVKIPAGIATELLNFIAGIAGINFDAEARIKQWQPFVDFLGITLMGAIDTVKYNFDPNNPDGNLGMIIAFGTNIANGIGDLLTTLTNVIFSPFDTVNKNINASMFDPAVPTSLIGRLLGFPEAIVGALKGLGDIIKQYLYDPFATWIGEIMKIIQPVLDAITSIKNTLSGESAGDYYIDTNTNALVKLPPGATPPPNFIKQNAKGGTFKGLSWVGEQGPELIYSPDKLGVLTNPISKAINSLVNPPSPSAVTNNTRTSTYSPVFNTPPTSDILRANTSLYDDWLRSSQGV